MLVPIARFLSLVLLLLIPSAHAESRRRDIVPDPEVMPPRTFIETATHVSGDLDESILQVRVEQVFVNHSGGMQEVSVLLPIPPDAVVTDGMLLADGQEIPADVLPADQARQIYEEIVRRRRDPALLELVGNGLIRLSAFPIPPGGTRTVTFRYHQPIAFRDGSAHLRFPLAALRGIGSEGLVDVHLALEGREPLTSVYSPSHDVDVKRSDARHANVALAARRPGSREVLEIDVRRERRALGVDLRTADGVGEDDYFLLAVSPGWDLLEERNQQPETVVFALDTSGSMQGEKFSQACEALREFVDALRPDDSFTIVAFSDRARTVFPDGPRRASRAAREDAMRWIESLRAAGGTAIADALDLSCRPSWEPTLVLFLTDGRPTVGPRSQSEILARAARAGEGARFFAFGVGDDVDARLLDALAEQGEGYATYVRPGQDIDEAVSELHQRVAHPCARDVRVEVAGARVREVYPGAARDLYAGEPLLVAGRVAPGARAAVVRVRGTSPDGSPLTGEWRVRFDDPSNESESVPVLWASRKAASLLDEIRRNGRDPELVQAVQDLSRRYGILTEEVALLAREDEVYAQAPSMPVPQSMSRKDGRMRTHAMRAPAGPPPVASMNGGAAALSAPQALDMAAKSTNLRKSTSASEVAAADGKAQTTVTKGGVTFEKQGDTWVDVRLIRGMQPVRKTVRIRPYGDAYFRITRGSAHAAEWFGVGEKVRVWVAGVVVEVTPAGLPRIADDVVQEIVRGAGG